MARVSMVVKLTATDEARTEGVQILAEGNSWSSPPGGWLSPQAGVWNQLADGLHLKDSAKTATVAILYACNFTLSKEGDTGRALYPANAKAGTWEVTATLP
jgi:hypothetical protein